MAVNKVIYAGEVLIDLTADTITAADLAEGKTAHDMSGAAITGTNTFDSDTSDATAAEAEVLAGKTAYARGAMLTGTMANNGGIEGVISAAGESYAIPVGFHDGSGTVAVDPDEAAKLVPGNIRSGVSILGVEGTMTGSEDVTAQAKTATPSAEAQTVLPDDGYNYLSQVTVEAIPYAEAENSAGGVTVTIA